MNKKWILRDSVVKSGVLKFFILEPDIIEPAKLNHEHGCNARELQRGRRRSRKSSTKCEDLSRDLSRRYRNKKKVHVKGFTTCILGDFLFPCFLLSIFFKKRKENITRDEAPWEGFHKFNSQGLSISLSFTFYIFLENENGKSMSRENNILPNGGF